MKTKRRIAPTLCVLTALSCGLMGAHASAQSSRPKAAPDGYTLGMAGNATMSIAPSLYAKLAYAPLKDFEPVTNLAAVTPTHKLAKHVLKKDASVFARAIDLQGPAS